ncbi:excinuclease ABC subunit A [Paraburkholderia kirstenboschensis]|uniref:Excinuclease ABC subunit A n=1 Tax=Paraburkholderia kirstenboschensis TaxID=1245436 RepID=A0ABZ0ES22_9BURK|nr:excinuclease ABC subunit A [Paraburkholderia kirstenboschensis]WOD19157.1 excinuclease ABC subunit A [Paraburkholderia kirstenboschensis]
MKGHLIFVTLAASFAMLSAAPAFARDTVNMYPINEALHSEPGKVGDDIPLYFAGQRHPAVVKTIGEYATNKKTNAFGKSDEAACQHVFLSAVIELQDRARKEGGNAVINIKSNYKNEVRESATEFTCGAGAVIAGVALKGDVVTLRK